MDLKVRCSAIELAPRGARSLTSTTARSVPTPADCCRVERLGRCWAVGCSGHVSWQEPESAVWGKWPDDAKVPVIERGDDIGAKLSGEHGVHRVC